MLLILLLVLVIVVVVEGEDPEAPPRTVSGAPKLVCLRSSDPNTRLPLDSSELLDASDAVLRNGPIRRHEQTEHGGGRCSVGIPGSWG